MVRWGDERGAAMAEYMPLLTVIALIVMFVLAFFGPWVGDRLIDASVQLDNNACPTGWTPTKSELFKRNGQKADQDGDGWACIKTIPGGGEGNTAKESNVKDNTRPVP